MKPGNKTRPERLTVILAYLAAGLVMVYLSYSLPRMLPGDFVEAMVGWGATFP